MNRNFFPVIFSFLLTSISIGFCQNLDRFKAGVKSRETRFFHCTASLSYTLEEPIYNKKFTGTIQVSIDNPSFEMVITPDENVLHANTLETPVKLTEVFTGGAWYDYYPDTKLVYLSKEGRSMDILGLNVLDLFNQRPYSPDPLSKLTGKYSLTVNGDIYNLRNTDEGTTDYYFDSSKDFFLQEYGYSSVGNVFKIICSPQVIQGHVYPKKWEMSLLINGGRPFRTLVLEIKSLNVDGPIPKIGPLLVSGCTFSDDISGSSCTIK